jgi:eukaryotic-like serine/threonine-protein kinase
MHLGARRSSSLATRMLIGAVLLLATVLALVFGILSRWAQRSGDAVVRRELEQSVYQVAQILSSRQRSLTGGARVFVQDPYFRSFVAEHRRDEVLDQSLEASEQLEADWVFVVDERGTILAKSDEPGAPGADMGSVPLIAGALQGHVTSGFGVSGDSMLFQAVAVPIVVPGGAPIGALVATKKVDSLLARDVKAATSADVVFFVHNAAGNRVAISTLGASMGPTLAAEITDRTRSQAVLGGVRYATQGASATTAGGDIVGGYVVLSARDAASADIAEVRRALLLAGLLGLALAGLAALIISRRVARPLRELTSVAQRATDGDYADLGFADAPSSAVVPRVDEVRSLDLALHRLVAELRDRQALVAALTASVPALGRMSAASSVAVSPSLTMHRVQGGTSRVVSSAPQPRGAHGERARGELAAGDVVAERYVIDALLGNGDFGVTYRARDRVTGTVVALKRLRPSPTGGEAATMELVREEVRAVRALVHRNVVRVHDAGDDAGVPFLTMDYVEGITLSQLLSANGPLAEHAVFSLAKQLCRALYAAELRGIVHGDLSPRQLIVAYEGVLKVGDFAPARIERRLRASEHGDASRHAAIPHLAGATVGSPEYMAPEQMLGEAPTASSDLYAAGVVLYECVTGATPFRTDSPLAFLAQKLGASESHAESDAMRAPQPSRSSTALLLRDVIGRMILPEADRRPESAGALLELLERAG